MKSMYFLTVFVPGEVVRAHEYFVDAKKERRDGESMCERDRDRERRWRERR